MRTLFVVCITLAVVLGVIPAVLVVFYGGWNDNYFMALGTTAVVYCFTFGVLASAAYEFMKKESR